MKESRKSNVGIFVLFSSPATDILMDVRIPNCASVRKLVLVVV